MMWENDVSMSNGIPDKKAAHEACGAGRKSKNQGPRLLEQTVKYKGNLIEVRDSRMVMNGCETHWDSVHYQGAAAVLPVLKDGRIVLVRQYRHLVGRDTLEIPAGKRNSCEEPYEKCAVRELEEETGFQAKSLKLMIRLRTTIALFDEEIPIYLAEKLTESTPHPDPGEDVRTEFWEPSELIKLIDEGRLQDGKTVTAILLYYLKYSQKPDEI